MYRTKQYLIEKGIGIRTHDDTFFILGCIWDKVYDKEITLEVVENINYLREMMYEDENYRKLAKDDIVKTGSIISKLLKSNISYIKIDLEILNEDSSMLEINYPTYEEFLILENEVALEQENEDMDEKSVDSKRGIYGIYLNDRLIYIGKTDRSFRQRFMEHRRNINNGSDMKLYNYIRKVREEDDDLQLIPLVVIEDLKTARRVFTKRDLECMELALITEHRPVCNIEGVKTDYVFR